MPLSQNFLEKFAKISVDTLSYDEMYLIIYNFYFFVYNVSVYLCYEVVSATQNQEFVQTRFFKIRK